MRDKQPLCTTRIELRVPKGAEELLPEDLYLLSPKGVWTVEQGGSVLVRFYPDDPDAFLEAVRSSGVETEQITVEEEELKDYSALTRRYFRPIRVEDLTILPPWSKMRPKGPHLIIEPGMAFGTGRHESTRLMVKIMRSVPFTGTNVLDLGCGSGILSLYAALLGAKRVFAIDNDPDTVQNTQKNVTLNEARAIEVACADLADVRGTYDVILANIDIRTFTQYATEVMAFAKPGAKLVVSGILGRDRARLLALLQPLSLIRMEQKNAWRGFLFQAGEAL